MLLGNDFQIDADLRYLFTHSVGDKEKEVLNNYVQQLNENEKIIFKKILEYLQDQSRYFNRKYNITKNSINLCIKIYKDTELKTFPFVHKIAKKSYSVSDGSFSFGVYKLDKFFPDMIHSEDNVRNFLKASNNIVFYTDFHTNIEMISAELKA